MNNVIVEDIEKGTFQGGEEECFIQKLNGDEPYVVLRQSDYLAMKNALETISKFNGESIWGDSRDDAADLMLEIAEDALKGKYNYEK